MQIIDNQKRDRRAFWLQVLTGVIIAGFLVWLTGCAPRFVERTTVYPDGTKVTDVMQWEEVKNDSLKVERDSLGRITAIRSSSSAHGFGKKPMPKVIVLSGGYYDYRGDGTYYPRSAGYYGGGCNGCGTSQPYRSPR